MDVIHEILNVVFPVFSIIFFVFLVPTRWFFNLIRLCFKFVYPEELARKVILITGASTGIGEHLAIEYAKEGACLILVARREKQLRMVAKNAKAVGSPDVIVIPADVSKLEDCNKIVDETIKHFDKIDYLINNAAIGKFGLFEDLKCLTDHTSVMDVNFWGSVYTTHFALPHLRKNKGKIIAICSCGGWFATPRVGVYNASKAALLSFFETLRIEVGSYVDILVVTPGMVETNLTDKDWLEEGNASWIPKISAQRCAKAIVNSTKRGDKYFTEPSWMKMVLLWKTFCPEILDSIMNFVFIIWPQISQKEKKN
ncbi:11-beta-hydroxysteroid dehydrogenase-like 2 [Lactuca sativa]|uniref:11-beta-hydroxysteroid dehydrogenase-like 2 n=1 Tax=Lactuca sativa TaxID=4236 RepID=UPI000CB0B86E|nr:11-beta-hydroxysteroid dehydrogenase-like 2 [Lactuca sativa]